jgi:glyoxylase-like metal-dependent hydrolase (beta-lactamase superfamily II)
MTCGRSRRDFVQAILSAAGGLALAPGRGVAAAQLPRQPGVVPLAPNLRLVSGFGGNVVVMKGSDGLLMVNGGAAPHSTHLLRSIGEATGVGQRVQVLFNTDWHPDHTASNEILGAAGTRIIAHEHTKQYLGAELFVDWQNLTYKPLTAKGLPTQTFYTKGSMTFGDERIEYGHLGQAHTDGDIYVFFPDSNVLVAGDVLAVGKYPIADYTTGGWLGGLAAATKTLLDLTNAETRVVPGHGPVQTRADVQAQHEMLLAVRDKLTKMMRQGLGSKDMLAAGVTREFDTTWGDPELFVSTSYRGLWLHVRELGGIV